MLLKKLEIAGFKSFAKKTSLTFASSITAIVGPNGSGKSNAAEAFRFVLGEQSMKSLRGKRTEDLIFNGSGNMPRSNRASVTLTFDNTKRLMDIDFDEVTIGRTVHRDASSDYTINGTQVRLKDLQELLIGAHIGSSGHHIISQGAADRILSVSVRERKEMVEDALGLRLYHYKIGESMKRLEKTRQNLEKAEGLRREIRPHVRFLKKQVEKTERARALREELTVAYLEYFKREELFLLYEHERLLEAKKPLEEEREQLEKKIKAATDHLEKLEKEYTKEGDVKKLEEEMQSLQQEKEVCARKLGRLEGALELEEKRNKYSNKGASEDRHIFSHEKIKKVKNLLETELKRALEMESLEEVKGLLTGVLKSVQEFFVQKDGQEKADSGAEIASLVELKEKQQACEKEMELLLAGGQTLREKIRLQREAREKETRESRDVERTLFSLKEALQKLLKKEEGLKVEQKQLASAQKAFDRERVEAGVLVGRSALSYKDTPLLTSDGKKLSHDEIVSEKREAQEQRRNTLERLKIRLEEMGAGSGEEVLKEYEQVVERDTFLEREITDLEHSAESLVQLITELEETLGEKFKEGLLKINTALSEFFELMFGGGSATLKIVREKRQPRSHETLLGTDEEEVIEEGIEIAVSLPKKKIRGLEMLSGGERALTSIALIFALSQVNPPPFLILDETDAALDEANSRRYGDMIERLAEHSQLILITHNRETMSRAGILYGVTMGGTGISQVLTVDLTEAEKVAK